MSASLESLMRDVIDDSRPAPLSAGLLSFIAVGGSGAIAFICLSTGMLQLGTGLPDWLVSALCYAVLVVPVYLMHRRYVAVQISAVLLTSLFSYVCYQLLGMQSWLGAFIVVGLTSGVNFVVLKLWAFAAPPHAVA